MKKILFSIAAIAMLVGCGSKDDDTPNGGNGNGGNGNWYYYLYHSKQLFTC